MMTITEAILLVMQDAGKPITAREAFEGIIERDLYEFKAQRPVQVVQSQIRRRCHNLEFPSAEATKYFQVESDGRYSALEKPIRRKNTAKTERANPALKESAHRSGSKTSLKKVHSDIRELQISNRELLGKRILSDLKKLAPDEFEDFARKFLGAYGFKQVKVTGVGPDGGIDGFGKLQVGLAQMGVAFQCKRWNKTNVGRRDIDQFRGAIQGQYEQGIFFTTAGFLRTALEISIRPGAVPIILIDGASLVDHMIDRQFGVEEEQIAIHTYALDKLLGEESATH
jgi:restriction system protein